MSPPGPSQVEAPWSLLPSILVPTRLNTPPALAALFLLAVALDLTLAIVFFAELQRWSFVGGFWHSLLSGLRGDEGDLLFLSLSRLGLLLLLSTLAYLAAVERAPARAAVAESRAVALLREAADAEQPLLADAPEAEPSRGRAEAAAVAPAEDGAAPPGRGRGGRKMKQLLQAVSLGLAVASQLYLGAKAVLLAPGTLPEASEALLLYSLAALAAAEAALLVALTDAAAARRWGAAGAAAPEPPLPPPSFFCDAGAVAAETLTPRAYAAWLVALAAPYRRRVALGGAALACETGAQLALPWLVGRALDAAIPAITYPADAPVFYSALRALGGLQAGCGAAAALRGVCLATAAAALAADARAAVLAALLRQDAAFFDAAAEGELEGLLEAECDAATAPASAAARLLRCALAAAGALALALSLSWRLALLAGSALWPVYAITAAAARFRAGLERRRAAAAARAARAAQAALRAPHAVRDLSAEWALLRQQGELCVAPRALRARQARAAAATAALSAWLAPSSALLLLGVGGVIVMRDDGELTAGRLVAFELLFALLDRSLRGGLAAAAQLAAAERAAGRIAALLALRPQIGSRGADAAYGEEAAAAMAAEAPPEAGEEAASALSFGAASLLCAELVWAHPMRPGSLVLDRFSLTLPAGAVAALVGGSGEAASALLLLLMRQYAPQSGRVMLGGVPLDSLPPPLLHAQVARVDGSGPIFAGSLRHNLTLGLGVERCEESALRLALSRCPRLRDWVAQLPRGLETEVGEAGCEPDAALARLLALARALLRRPRLLLLDAPAADLPPAGEREVQEAVEGVISQRGCTVLLAARRLAQARAAGLVVVLQGGRVVEQGAHEELLRAGDRRGKEAAGLYEQLVARQAEAQAGRLRRRRSSDRQQSALERAQEAEWAAAAAGGDVGALLSNGAG